MLVRKLGEGPPGGGFRGGVETGIGVMLFATAPGRLLPLATSCYTPCLVHSSLQTIGDLDGFIPD